MFISSERQQVDVPFNQYEFDTNYLYTFYECGTYQITSDRFQESATVVVYSESSIKTYKRRLQEPKVVGELPISCPFGDKIRLESPDRFVTIYYTLDGRIPTRRHEDVQIYNPDERISLVKPGLLVIRAYSTEDQKLASAVTTTWPILVMENEGLNNATTMWKNCNISLTASLARPNKIYGEIHVEPEYCDLIDHFELYVDDVARGTNLNSYELNFAAGGFAGGKQYEIHIVAYPIDIIVNEQPIVSNKRVCFSVEEISDQYFEVLYFKDVRNQQGSQQRSAINQFR
ncbi:unnamed protein product [Didymodactylos carnosus]|uniref:Uncharacterized protein n=1 Tax=Didymodactylos carnosus TaxID=1234261 RepID=A0A8S2TXE5_9BILA|nr:unnamed protein product [Didymodactylos carnosus]CAF4304541.1 unnamed protein product [Didymodactylos carnosus]